jgi:hypothetical protein
MFRTGGTPNEGIMHGLVNRRGYSNGTEAERYRDEYMKMLAEIQPAKPKFNMGQMGLNLISGEYAGEGLLQNIARSARDPYAAFTAADDARGGLDYQKRMTATTMGIKRAEAEELARRKAITSGKEFKDIKVAEELGKIIPQIYVLEEKLKTATDKKEIKDIKIKLDVLNTKRRNFSKNNPITEATLEVMSKSTAGIRMFDNIIQDLFRQDKIDGTNKYKSETDKALITDAMKELRARFEEFSRSSNADGGRIGYNIGSPGPMQETSPVEENPISYDQLRSRLPEEITNDIVRLLSVSAEALEDFANISSQKDVDNFNKKYSVNLVLPSEA